LIFSAKVACPKSLYAIVKEQKLFMNKDFGSHHLSILNLPSQTISYPVALLPFLVGVTGVEPVTSSLSGTRSNQLSYTPESASSACALKPVFASPWHPAINRMVEATGFEPVTPSLQSSCSAN
jgi:hypothetical protein